MAGLFPLVLRDVAFEHGGHVILDRVNLAIEAGPRARPCKSTTQSARAAPAVRPRARPAAAAMRVTERIAKLMGSI